MKIENWKGPSFDSFESSPFFSRASLNRATRAALQGHAEKQYCKKKIGSGKPRTAETPVYDGQEKNFTVLSYEAICPDSGMLQHETWNKKGTHGVHSLIRLSFLPVVHKRMTTKRCACHPEKLLNDLWCVTRDIHEDYHGKRVISRSTRIVPQENETLSGDVRTALRCTAIQMQKTKLMTKKSLPTERKNYYSKIQQTAAYGMKTKTYSAMHMTALKTKSETVLVLANKEKTLDTEGWGG